MMKTGLCFGAFALVLAFAGSASAAAPVQVTVDVSQPLRSVNPLIYGSQIEAKMESDQKIKDFVGWSGLEFFRLWGGSGGDFLWDEPREVVQSRYPCLGVPPDGDLNQSVWADTDDTLDWFDSIGLSGSRLMFTVPAGYLTPERAAAWVDYVNNVRGEGVVYWVVGGEPWGDWDCDSQTPEAYAALFNAYAAAMKAVDPEIKMVASVGGKYWDAITNWDRTVINLAGDNIDALCYHWYPGMQMDYSDPAAAALWVIGNVLCLKPKVIDRYVQLIAEEAPNRVGEIEIGIGEVDGAAESPTSDLPPYEQDVVGWGVGDMLFWAGYLGEAQQEGIAFSAQYSLQECPFGLIRGWSVWGGWGGDLWDEVTIRGKAYALKLYRDRFRGMVVETSVTDSDTFYKPLQWREETYEGDVPYVAAYSALNPDDTLCVMVINRHPTESRTVTLTVGGYDVGTTATLYDLGGTASSIIAQNDWDYGDPSGEIAITELALPATNPFTYGFPAHSCTAVVFAGTPGPRPPIAAFSGSPRSGFPSVTVTFTDQSMASPTSWSWDFGDGGGSAAQSPTHAYTALGAYDVSLTATNDLGSDTETKTSYIVVTFTDVPRQQWAFASICACYNAGIVTGYPGGYYQPALEVSRDQMAVFVSRALAGGDALVPSGPATATFWDVPTDHWAFRYVEYAAENRVVGGYGGGEYRPTETVTRDQMAVFIARALVGGDAFVPPGPMSAIFPDVPTDHWAYNHVEYIAAEGVTGGYPDGTYRPEAAVTRDQMAVYMQRAFALPM